MTSTLLLLPKPEAAERPLVVSYGAGVDSTAMLIGLWSRGMRPDLILFADTGGEKPQTYAYLNIMDAWLFSVGFPTITRVRRVPPKAPYKTLEGNCLANETLPSLAFGMKSCSIEWKVKPQHRFLNTWQPAIDTWTGGGKVVRALGFDASPADQKRSARVMKAEIVEKVRVAVGLDASPADQKRAVKAKRSSYAGGGLDSHKYDYWYPLQEWGWNREACREVIAAAGLPVPDKSSCFFCPAMKVAEIVELREVNPDLHARALALEERALTGKHGLRSTKGLGRRFAWRDVTEDSTVESGVSP